MSRSRWFKLADAGMVVALVAAIAIWLLGDGHWAAWLLAAFVGLPGLVLELGGTVAGWLTRAEAAERESARARTAADERTVRRVRAAQRERAGEAPMHPRAAPKR